MGKFFFSEKRANKGGFVKRAQFFRFFSSDPFPYTGFVFFFYTSFIIYISSSIPRHGLGGEGPYPNPTKPYLDLGYQEYLEYLEYLETGHFSKICLKALKHMHMHAEGTCVNMFCVYASR